MQEEYLKDSEKETAVISETVQDTEPKDDIVVDKDVKNVKETGKKEGRKTKFVFVGWVYLIFLLL